MKLIKVNQSNIAVKKYCAIQIEPTKNANICKDFLCNLAGNVVRKFPFALNRNLGEGWKGNGEFGFV